MPYFDWLVHALFLTHTWWLQVLFRNFVYSVISNRAVSTASYTFRYWSISWAISCLNYILLISVCAPISIRSVTLIVYPKIIHGAQPVRRDYE